MIPDMKQPRRLVVGEDRRTTMTDIVTGKSQYQNWWKKTQSFRTHLDNETGNQRAQDGEKERDREHFRSA